MRQSRHRKTSCRTPADFPSFSEGLSLRLETDFNRTYKAANFPSFSEGLSLRRMSMPTASVTLETDFPSFSEGLSLRRTYQEDYRRRPAGFPFLFGGTFIEAILKKRLGLHHKNFPSFSEGLSLRRRRCGRNTASPPNFPSFSEGLSLRRTA